MWGAPGWGGHYGGGDDQQDQRYGGPRAGCWPERAAWRSPDQVH